MEDLRKYYRAYAEIDLEAIRRNAISAKDCAGTKTELIAVVKTDAYGHGAVPVAKAVYDYVAGYAVATIDEALELREAGIDKTIISLGYISPYDYELLITNDIIAPIYDYEQAKQLSDMAVKLNKDALCHIKVDTGMNRIGIDAKSEVGIKAGCDVISQIVKLPMLNVDGIFTHFATSDEADKTLAVKQYELFIKLIDKLNDMGISFKHKHCSNSAAIIDLPQFNMDWVRQGIALYGLYPSDEVNKRRTMLFPALSLKSHIVHIKDVEPDWGISYGQTFVAKEKMRVATVSIGYGDGYPRMLSNKGYVLIRGKKAPILGRVCMDQFMVDVTHIEDAAMEDIVTLVGRDGTECITIEELSQLCGRFNYEFICDINKRVTRIYKNLK